MPDSIPYLNVFLSSPGDVAEERASARKIMKRLPNRPTYRGKVALNIITWDDLDSMTAMEASLTPKEAINKGLPLPSQCDIVIAIFWSRMGTPFVHTDGKLYESGTYWEILDALNSSTTKTYIYRRMSALSIGFDDPDRDRKIEQYDRVKKFFDSEIFYQDGEILRGIQQYDTPADFDDIFERNFEEIIWRTLSQLSDKDRESRVAISSKPEIQVAESLVWPADKLPFLGLRSFDEVENDIFFGRNFEIYSIVQQLTNSRFIAVIGASGSGKSSLVRAGVIPTLRKNAIIGSKDWKFIYQTPGKQPFESLYDAILRAFPQFKPNPLEAHRIKQNFVMDMREAPEELLNICSAGLEDAPEWAEVLLFVDQFEEVFALSSKEDTLAFIQLLGEIATSVRMRVVVTMRHDFFPTAIENRILAELLRGEAVFPLAIPKRDALGKMIEYPAELAGLHIEAGLVNRLLDDVGDEPGNLALMAYALGLLYQTGKKDKELTLSSYDQMGGLTGVISARAEDIFKQLPGNINENMEILPQILIKLIRVEDGGVVTRQSAAKSDLYRINGAKSLLDSFLSEKVRLLVTAASIDVATIEVAHEALFHSWYRFSDWITQNKEDLYLFSSLQTAIQKWNKFDRNKDYLLRGERLLQTYEAIVRLDAINEVVKEFIDESFQAMGIIRISPIWKNQSHTQYESDIIVLMPFAEKFLDTYECIKESGGQKRGLLIKRADDFFTQNSVMDDIWNGILASELIIADCTDRNPNVFYELGIAHTLGKPTILITQNDEDIPFDLRHLRYIHYDTTPRGIKKLERDLLYAIDNLKKANIKLALPSGYSQPIWGKPQENGQYQSDVFMIMPFRDELKPVYIDHVKSVVERSGQIIRRGDDIFTQNSIMADIWSAIYGARCIIADLTDRNANVFYELGITHTLGKRVIMMTQQTEDVPYDLHHLRYIKYKFTPSGMKAFETQLRDALTALGI